MTLLVGILLALAGWSLSRTFELSTTQAVLENQIDQLEFRVQMLDEKMDDMQNSDKKSWTNIKNYSRNSNQEIRGIVITNGT